MIEYKAPAGPTLDTPLLRDDIERLFRENCVWMGQDMIPEHRVLELFGAYLAPELDKMRNTVCYDGSNSGWVDWTPWTSVDGPIHLYTKRGFEEIAAMVNADILYRELGGSDMRVHMIEAEVRREEAERAQKEARIAARKRKKEAKTK